MNHLKFSYTQGRQYCSGVEEASRKVLTASVLFVCLSSFLYFGEISTLVLPPNRKIKTQIPPPLLQLRCSCMTQYTKIRSICTIEHMGGSEYQKIDSSQTNEGSSSNPVLGLHKVRLSAFSVQRLWQKQIYFLRSE